MEACSPAGGNKTGHEFMPDMVHSTAVEANIYNYYFYNTWGDEESYKELIMPRKPVAGSVPRGMASVYYADNMVDRVKKTDGFAGMSYDTEIALPANGGAPYYYGDNDDERLRAITEIVDNPFPITGNGLERGEELYVVFCGICHGDKADGNGYLVREANPATGDFVGGLYPAAPANFLLPQFIDTTNGLYYHSIMYGKNVMGGYADKLSYEERWQVIHYIRSLQAKNKKLKYDENENTLNGTSISFASIADMMEHDADVEEHGEEADHDGEGGGEHESDHGQENGGHGH
jgi:hypothetical protein